MWLASHPTEAFEVLFKRVVSKSMVKMGLKAVEQNLHLLAFAYATTQRSY
jgi:hypothetical protein